MDLFSDLIAAVQSDLTIGTESTLFTPTTVKNALNRAYRTAGGLFLWPETEDAKKTSTVANQEYYDYPQNWRPDSVWKLKVDGTDYGEPLVFKDYLYEIENNFPSLKKNIWSSQWRRFFLRSQGNIPSTNGSLNIEVWGQKTVDTLVNDGDTTIFSYSMSECNEALVIEAVQILKEKAEDHSDNVPRIGNIKSLEAKQILATAWGKVQKSQAKYQKTQPFFNVMDMFAGRNKIKNKIGDF